MGPLLLLLMLLVVLGGGELGTWGLPTGCKHDGCAQGTSRAAGAQNWVVYKSLELSQVLPPDSEQQQDI
ncbi:hypothetical protein I79_019075 [Cricetulus griseus]|uniref:Uncharacterized protein n=1 Tax=Cricetulus griseus TaxID=10029 RepID=G3I6F4_CRIGR|nr:hypothetical protein I79_019075 [Cricetulus griseus]ERE84765.1 putative G-protein coupled receptor [Cricetulus griseus]